MRTYSAAVLSAGPRRFLTPKFLVVLFFASLLPAQTSAPASDLTKLQTQISDELAKIHQLEQAMSEEQKLLDAASASRTAKTSNATALSAASTTAASTTAASTTNVARPIKLVPVVSSLGGPYQPTSIAPQAASPSAANPCDEGAPSPTFLRVGNTCIIPIGTVDLDTLWRDKNAGNSVGTNWGGIPYNNVANGKNSEFRFTSQPSRIGFRLESDWKGTHFMVFNEDDFLGTSGATNIGVTNGAFLLRLKLFWLDVKKGKVEFLAGQSWSMLTPNRTGISALPNDLFYGLGLNVNDILGQNWTRQPAMRVLLHPSEKVTFGLSFESPDQYMGGSGGGGAITLPAALTGLAATQLDNGGTIGTANTVLTTPTVAPDIIAKLAFDPNSRFHFEVAGITSQFKIWNPNTGKALGAGEHFSATGAGVQVAAIAGLTKNFRLISANYWSDGDGRYMYGQAPDVIVRANGSLSPVHSGGVVEGFEANAKNTVLFAYYGGVLIERNTALDANGTSLIGYGYKGSANSQNRAIQEGTFGFNQTLWRNTRYGALNLIGQWEFTTRDPWSVAIGTPKATHLNTIFFDVRYTLPGSMPKF